MCHTSLIRCTTCLITRPFLSTCPSYIGNISTDTCSRTQGPSRLAPTVSEGYTEECMECIDRTDAEEKRREEEMRRLLHELSRPVGDGRSEVENGADDSEEETIMQLRRMLFQLLWLEIDIEVVTDVGGSGTTTPVVLTQPLFFRSRDRLEGLSVVQEKGAEDEQQVYEEREYQGYLVEADVDQEVEVNSPYNIPRETENSGPSASAASLPASEQELRRNADNADDEPSERDITEAFVTYWRRHHRHRPQPLSNLPSFAQSGVSGIQLVHSPTPISPSSPSSTAPNAPSSTSTVHTPCFPIFLPPKAASEERDAEVEELINHALDYFQHLRPSAQRRTASHTSLHVTGLGLVFRRAELVDIPARRTLPSRENAAAMGQVGSSPAIHPLDPGRVTEPTRQERLQSWEYMLEEYRSKTERRRQRTFTKRLESSLRGMFSAPQPRN